MSNRTRRAFRDGFNNYVPALQYASDMVIGQPAAFSLGLPAVASSNNIAAAVVANAAPGTIEAYAYTSDSPYGRTVNVSPSADPGAAGGAVNVFGFDYLGQPMAEQFTGISGSTEVKYGRKAFYKVTKTVIVTAATNAITWRVGIGSRLGLPYKGDIVWAKEATALVNLFKRDVTLYQPRSAADAVAGCSKWFRSPCPGWVSSLIGTPDGGGGGTDPVITVKLATNAITGLTVTVDTSDVAGLTVTDAPTNVNYSANNRLVANTLIEVVGAAAAGAHGDTIGIVISPTQFFAPTLTDPQTLTTADPRGTYESLLTMDGTKEIVVGLSGDNSVNAAGNGGYHGIKHVIA